jgi:hypothetical protein
MEMLDGSFQPSAARPDTYPWALADAAAMTAWTLRDAAVGDRPPPDVPEVADPNRGAALMVSMWGSACPAGTTFQDMLPNFLATAGASPHLPPAAAADMWRRIAASPCARRASEADRAWFSLFIAVAARDPDAMSAWGTKLLDGMRGAHSGASEYALLAALAGHACRGRTEDADQLFAKGTREWIRPGMHAVELRYLYALSHAAAVRRVGGAACVTALAR